MTGFEPRTSGIGSDRSTNWATTTAHGSTVFRGIIIRLATMLYEKGNSLLVLFEIVESL